MSERSSRLARRRIAAAILVLAALAISASRIIAQDGAKKAEYLSAETCLGCHEGKDKAFMGTKHRILFSNLKEKGPKAGCEGCHGAGDGHMDNPEAGVLHFSKATPEQSSKACLKCHDKGNKKNWRVTAHAQEGVSCSTCHKVHDKKESRLDKSKNEASHLLADSEPDLCVACHKEKSAEMNRPYHHPLKEGKVTCSDCHSAHDTSAAAMDTAGQNCVQCHAEKAGPFKFEHEPVAESCTTCHKPHGSANSSLLALRVPSLCLQCHSPAVNAPNHDLTDATIKECTDCHSYVHGSNTSDTFQMK